MTVLFVYTAIAGKLLQSKKTKDDGKTKGKFMIPLQVCFHVMSVGDSSLDLMRCKIFRDVVHV